MGVRRILAAVLAAGLVSGPVSAACWSNDVVDAAYVRDLDTILMVATLRCRVQGVQMGESYNRFVREKRAVLTAANDQLRAQFAIGRSAKAGLDAYDSYVTSLANSHGAGSDTLDCGDYKALVEQAVAAAPDRNALLKLAARAGANPSLPAQACTRQVAFAH